MAHLYSTDEAIMRQSDWLIDIGPGAGQHGGTVIAMGTPAEIIANPASLTGRFLAGQSRGEPTAERTSGYSA